jgi:hypothetical protein
VMENVVAFEVCRAFLDKFAGDSMHEVQASYESFMEMARALPLEPPLDVHATEDATEA